MGQPGRRLWLVPGVVGAAAGSVAVAVGGVASTCLLRRVSCALSRGLSAGFSLAALSSVRSFTLQVRECVQRWGQGRGV